MELAPDSMVAVDEFTLDVSPDRSRFDTLLYKGRVVASVEARIAEAQFRLPDGNTLLLLNDDTPFRETLTVLLVSPGLKVVDRMLVGGAFTPGYLTSAYPISDTEVAICWHDLDQIIRVAQRRRWLGLRSRWLTLRDLPGSDPNIPRALWPELKQLLPAPSQWPRPTLPSGWARRLLRR